VKKFADLNFAVLVDGLGRELHARRGRGHATVDLIVKLLERPGAKEQHLARVDVNRGLFELLVLVHGDRVEDPLALDQRQQSLLDVDTGDVRLAADDRRDLVDLVDAHVARSI
jgi:hypothetical protein